MGEKVTVFETPMSKCDIRKIKGFFEAMPTHIQNEMIVLGVANYCLQSNNNEFINTVHEALFSKCDKKCFVRYE